MAFLKDKKIRTLIIIMSVLVAIGLLVSRSYYQSVNASFDPRVVPAKELYVHYNALAEMNDFESIFELLDSIEIIYNTWPYYQNSYEVGVLYNNRAASYLIMAMHKDSLNFRSKFFEGLSLDTLFWKAQLAVDTSITIYENWLEKYAEKTEAELQLMLEGDFLTGLEDYTPEEQEKYKRSRLKELQSAQIECPRRLSVSYTNLGIIHRNRKEYEMAINQYKKAIDLWDRNLVAQNNLNLLLGRPLKKQNIIQKLFPPEKDD